jgi:hypothetical protein
VAQSDLERVGKALELINKGLKPLVEREMLAKYSPRWRYEAVKTLRDYHFTEDGQDINLDTQTLILNRASRVG